MEIGVDGGGGVCDCSVVIKSVVVCVVNVTRTAEKRINVANVSSVPAARPHFLPHIQRIYKREPIGSTGKSASKQTVEAL